MITVALWVGVLLIALTILIKASDVFTFAAEKVGLYYKIPAFIVGVTIVSIGTSLPELISSLIAVNQGASEYVVGNVIGSNIANIFLILGVASVVGAWKKKIIFKFNLANVDLPILAGSAFLLAFAIIDGAMQKYEAIFFLLGYVVYVLYSISKMKETEHDVDEKELLEQGLPKIGRYFPARAFSLVVLSGIFIYIGAQFTIEAVTTLSKLLNIGTEVLALTVVALGTSLPELTVTIAAARRGGYEMALGNIFGSNIFNTFVVMSVPVFFGSVTVPKTVLFFHLPMMIAATLLAVLMTEDKEITKWEGFVLLLFYVFFIVKSYI